MDSLLATYTSSDEEDDERHQKPPPSRQPSAVTTTVTTAAKASSSPFLSLPPPKSSSGTSSSLSNPQKHEAQQVEQDSNPRPKSSALFSSLPVPRSQTTHDFPISAPIPKRVVQFRPPIPQISSRFEDEDEEEVEEDEEERERKKRNQIAQDTSVKSFLSTMPTPKNPNPSLLGALPISTCSGRRSIIETEGPTPSNSQDNGVNIEVGFEKTSVDGSHLYSSYEVGVTGDQSYVGYDDYSAYGSSSSGYDNYGSVVAMVQDTSEGVERFVRMGGKRRKDQAPTEIVEVKQDELIKNRPREDQAKLTGMAFGPSYQPASSKGKPSKLHKRKHQISSLYFDMRQKETELAERRAKGFLTKAETQAKYGW